MLQVAERFGSDATVVTLIPDGGRGYLSKFYDDNWLREYGIVERHAAAPTIEEVLAYKRQTEEEVPPLIFVESHRKVGEAVDLMHRYGISQIPVVRHEPADSLADVIGSIQERGLLERVLRNPDTLNEEVAAAMDPPLRAVEMRESVDTVFSDLEAGNSAVIVASAGKPVGVLSRADLLEYLAHNGTG
jgi:cystathionine beta-synthase